MTIMRTLITKYTPDEFVSINEFNQEIGEYWYVLGAYASDGYVCNSGISIEVRESDAVWLKKLDSVIHSWFGLTGHWSQRVINSHKYYRLRHHSILLSQYFSKLGIYQIATVLNRTPRAVSLKARRLNLLKAKGVQ